MAPSTTHAVLMMMTMTHTEHSDEASQQVIRHLRSSAVLLNTETFTKAQGARGQRRIHLFKELEDSIRVSDLCPEFFYGNS